MSLELTEKRRMEDWRFGKGEVLSKTVELVVENENAISRCRRVSLDEIMGLY